MLGQDGEHLINPFLLKLARDASTRLGGFSKQAFVPGGGMGGGDPSQGGGDPSQGVGGDPMAAGGDPMGGGGGQPPSDPRIDQLMQQMQQLQQQMQSGGGGGAGGGSGAGGLKPKIDVNVEIMQMKNILAKICDHLGINVPVQDMVATPDKLNAMAQGQPTSTPTGGGGGGGGVAGAIGGIEPMQGSGVPGGEKIGSYKGNGVAFNQNGFTALQDKATAIWALRKSRK